MRVTVLAGMLLLAAPAYAEDTLPDAMMGYWSMGDEDGIMERADSPSDFIVEKDKYYTVDDVCTILHIEKLTGTSYLRVATMKATIHLFLAKYSTVNLK